MKKFRIFLAVFSLLVVVFIVVFGFFVLKPAEIIPNIFIVVGVAGWALIAAGQFKKYLKGE